MPEFSLKLGDLSGSPKPDAPAKQLSETLLWHPLERVLLSYTSGGCAGLERRVPVADLMHSLWEADVLVFKAHITTSPAGKVADIFWIYDHRSELPDNHR